MFCKNIFGYRNDIVTIIIFDNKITKEVEQTCAICYDLAVQIGNMINYFSNFVHPPKTDPTMINHQSFVRNKPKISYLPL